MLRIVLDEAEGIAILEPNGRLSVTDFEAAARVIDPFIEKHGDLKGIVIHVKHFPGWDNFSSLVAHLKFVKGHHKKIARVAFSTDSPVGSVAEDVAAHFVNAEVRKFDFDEFEASRQWILDDNL